MRMLRGVLLTAAITLCGCGGSSSESPWPVEPLDTEPGPEGEAPPTGDATDVGAPTDWDEEADAGAAEPP